MAKGSAAVPLEHLAARRLVQEFPVIRSIAQMARALGFGPKGSWFEAK